MCFRSHDSFGADDKVGYWRVEDVTWEMIVYFIRKGHAEREVEILGICEF